jgi:hypothetical protein
VKGDEHTNLSILCGCYIFGHEDHEDTKRTTKTILAFFVIFVIFVFAFWGGCSSWAARPVGW